MAEWKLIQKRAANDLLNLLIIYHEDESKDCSSKVNALYQTLGDKIIKEPTLNEPKKKKLQKRLEAKESNVLDSIQTYVDISQRKFERKIEKALRSTPDVPMDTMEGTSKAPETDNEQPPKNPPAPSGEQSLLQALKTLTEKKELLTSKEAKAEAGFIHIGGTAEAKGGEEVPLEEEDTEASPCSTL